MGEKAAFSLKQRNPDVLTSIANLSNDEVFTPPSFANQMLDTIEEAWAKNNKGAIIWEDKDVTFLDPFTKSGVFLREITSRLTKGLEKQIPDAQERVNHILTKQVFGVAITELTALLARRSVYCSKHANGKHSICDEFDTPEGNIWFERTEHTWVGGKEKVITVDDNGNEIESTTDGTCKFCGAKQQEYERGLESESHAYALIHSGDQKSWIKRTFGEDMQFDVIVGNPPYQLDDGGHGTSARPIYHLFVEQAKMLEPKLLSMVIPARWYAGGKGLDNFRKAMLSDNHLRNLVDYFDSSTAFPGVDISGGVCFFLWARDSPGNCLVRNRVLDSDTSAERPLIHAEAQVFIRFNQAVAIVEKVLSSVGESFATGVSSRKPFGLPTNASISPVQTKTAVYVRAYPKDGYVERSSISKNEGWISSHKVLMAKAYGERGNFPYLVTGRPFYSPPGTACTETYIVHRICSSKIEAMNVISYMHTRFFRFLVLLQKNTQDATASVFRLVPTQDFSKPWTDSELYAKYKLAQEEIDFIESMIRPMELEDA